MTGRLHTLRPFLRRQWGSLAVAAGATIVATAANLASPFPLKIIIDRLVGRHGDAGFQLTGSDVGLLAWTAGLVVLIALANAAAQYVSDVTLQRAGERIVHDLRVVTYAQLQRLSLAFHERQHAGDLATRVTGDVNAIGDLFANSLGTLVASGLLLIGMAVVTLILDPPVALAAFCITPVLAVVTFRFRWRLKSLAREQRRKEGEIASMATETLGAIRVVKAFGSEGFEHRRLARTSEERRQLGIDAAQLEGRYSGAVDVLGAVGAALVLVVGVLRVAGGHLTPGDLVVVTSYARKVYQPLRAIARQAARVSRTVARAERVADILHSDELLPDRHQPAPAARARGDLALEGVTFAYSPDRPALAGIDLAVAAGEKVAIVGPSGAGKSTIAALVARFYDADEGVVRLDGHDLRDRPLGWLRDQVALVLQDTVLFTGSVLENIAYGLEVDRERVMAAAKAAGAHGFILQLPEGYDTELGPRGLRLSGGQRQRIAIARTLLRDPPVLVLDEPTTGLDAESEAQVLRGLDALTRGRTTLLITHSLALARRADHVVVLDDGGVVQRGRPADLLEADGQFRRLAAEQGLAPPARHTSHAVVDSALPQMPVLLDPDSVASLLARSVPDGDLPDVRVRYVRYRPGASLCVHYDVAVGSRWHEAVVLAKADGRLGARAARPDSVALAQRINGRSPVAEPLVHDEELDVLVQWLPLDLWLPLLGEPAEGLRDVLRAAGVEHPRRVDPTVLSYRPRRRVVLRLGSHVLKAYGREPDFLRASTGLEVAVQMGGVGPRLEGALPDRRVTVQSWMAGRRPQRSVDAAEPAGALLRSLHGAELAGLPAVGPDQQLDAAARTVRLAGAIAPWLAARADMLLGALELSKPERGEAVSAHGDFHAGQLVLDGGTASVVDLDKVCAAPAAFDVASFAAHVVRGDDGDLDRALEIVEAMSDSYGGRPDALAWHLSVAVLRRATAPFRCLDEAWSARMETIVAVAEEALAR